MRDLFDAPDADAELLGLLAQSIYAGLMMHSAFNDTHLSPDTYARIYKLLATFAADG